MPERDARFCQSSRNPKETTGKVKATTSYLSTSLEQMPFTLTLQGGVVELLHRHKKGVHVHMDDFPMSHWALFVKPLTDDEMGTT